MEKDEEKILNKIEEDIDSQSRLVSDAIEQEIATMRADQIDFFKEGLKKETDTYLEKELSDLRVYAAMKASQDKLKSKKALLSLRHQYAQEIEDTAEQKLKDFTASADYRGYLETALKQVTVSKDGYFLVKEADTALMKDILSKQGLNNEVKTRYFAIGGFLYVDEAQHLEYSCDLSERLRDATDWFHGHSGFSIAEGGEN